MTDEQKKRLEKIRGELPREEPGARGMEHMARNPSCTRLAAITIAGTNPATVSEKVYGLPAKEGLSPFAIRRGERFEAALFADDCKRILHMYQTRGRLGEEETVWKDLSQLFPEPNQDGLRGRQEQSEQWIRDRMAGKATPNLLIKPRLVVDIMGDHHPVEPDALVAGEGDLIYRPVEIKSYADRRGRTDSQKTGSACRQASVSIVALEQLLGQKIPPIIDLVFAKPATNWPTLHVMNVQAELQNLSQAFENAQGQLEQIEQLLEGEGLHSLCAVQKLPNHLCRECASHCPLWESCLREARERGDIALWGDTAVELLADVSDMQEAAALQNAGFHSQGADLDMLARVLLASKQAHQKIFPKGEKE